MVSVHGMYEHYVVYMQKHAHYTGACVSLQQAVSVLSSSLASATLVAEQACLLPTSPDNTPLVGAVPGVEGLYVAAGHGCWGILMAPATGLVMAELLTTGRGESVDIRGLQPARLRR